MKPRTRYQRQVMATAKGMKPATKRQIKWAFRECLEHYAFRTKSGTTTCLDCGHQWTVSDGREKQCRCPKCKARLQVENTLRRKARSSSYYTVAETKGGLQILRTFLLSANYEVILNYHDEVLRFVTLSPSHFSSQRISAVSPYANTFNPQPSPNREPLRKDKEKALTPKL